MADPITALATAAADTAAHAAVDYIRRNAVKHTGSMPPSLLLVIGNTGIHLGQSGNGMDGQSKWRNPRRTGKPNDSKNTRLGKLETNPALRSDRTQAGHSFA